MGLLDEWSRRATQHRAGRVEFLGEQTGSVEDTFKRDLIFEFTTRPDIRRAYLATVSFEPKNEASVALCIVSARPDDRSVVMRVGEIANRRFDKDAALDIVFLTPEQEREIASVCPPFYSSVG
jgi:hypothetical protein